MSSIETRSSASLETRDMRHLPEGQAHRGGFLYLLPCVGLGREDVTFLPTTRRTSFITGGPSQPRFTLATINFFVSAINLLWPGL